MISSSSDSNFPDSSSPNSNFPDSGSPDSSSPNFSSSSWKGRAALNIGAVIWLGLIIVAIMVGVYYFWPTAGLGVSCSAQKMLNASIQVRESGQRSLLGFNTDTDSLKFGAASPGVMSRRSVLVQHDQDANVLVTLKGDFEPWVKISPAEFSLKAGETQEVYVEVHVPMAAPDGNYSGQVIFCFR